MVAMSDINNLEAEFTVIGVLSTDANAYYKTGNLKQEHFFEPILGDMFTKLSTQFEQGLSSDILFLSSAYPQHKDVIRAIMARAISTNFAQTCQLIVDLADKRKVKKLFQEYAEKIDATTNIHEVLAEIDSKLVTSKDTFQIRTEQQVCVDILEAMKVDNACFGTGYPRLDEAMQGGLYKKKTYCIAARQKVGKSVCLGSISHNLSKAKVKHLFIAAEMGCNEILQRSIAHDIGRNSIAFYKEEDRKSEKFNKTIADYAVANKNTAILCDAPSISFDKLKRLILSAKKRYNIEGVVLDYLQIVTGMKSTQNEAQFQGDVAQWLAEVAKKEDIFVLYAAQLNREGLLRGSDGIRNAVDQLYMLHQPSGDTKGERYFTMDASRYTLRTDLGSSTLPQFIIDKHGPYLKEIA